MLAITSSRRNALAVAPFCISTTKTAVFDRSGKLVMKTLPKRRHSLRERWNEHPGASRAKVSRGHWSSHPRSLICPSQWNDETDAAQRRRVSPEKALKRTCSLDTCSGGWQRAKQRMNSSSRSPTQPDGATTSSVRSTTSGRRRSSATRCPTVGLVQRSNSFVPNAPTTGVGCSIGPSKGPTGCRSTPEKDCRPDRACALD